MPLSATCRVRGKKRKITVERALRLDEAAKGYPYVCLSVDGPSVQGVGRKMVLALHISGTPAQS